MKPQFLSKIDECKSSFITANKNTPCFKCGSISKNGSWKIKGKSPEARYSEMCAKLNLNPQDIKMNLKHTKDVVLPTWNNICSKISYKFICSTCEQGAKPKSKAVPESVKKELKKTSEIEKIVVESKPKRVKSEIKVVSKPEHKKSAIPKSESKKLIVPKSEPKVESKKPPVPKPSVPKPPQKKKIIEPSSDDEYEYYDD